MFPLLSKFRPRRNVLRGLFWILLGLLSAWFVIPWALRKKFDSEIEADTRCLTPLYEKFSRTSWSEAHPGEGIRDFKAFYNSCPIEADSTDNPICILPLGMMTPAEQETMSKTAEYLGIFFHRPVKQLPADPLDNVPAHARRIHPEWGNEQLLAGYLLEKHVGPAASAGAVATLGFTMTDIWPGAGWNFVFGMARLGSGIGVHSFHKYGNPNGSGEEYREFLLRSLKIAGHETGHMFGIPHCVAYRCGMNGSNGLDDTDDAPLMFCPDCLRKIWWANRIEPKAWFARLEGFLRREGLASEADRCLELSDALD